MFTFSGGASGAGFGGCTADGASGMFWSCFWSDAGGTVCGWAPPFCANNTELSHSTEDTVLAEMIRLIKFFDILNQRHTEEVRNLSRFSVSIIFIELHRRT